MAAMDRIIRWSIANRLVVVIVAVAILGYGSWTAIRMPVDVFPDLTAPTVTIVTEAHGLAPQEVESLVTIPIESSVNGSTGVRRVRSSSGIGISIVWVEFDWGTDIYVARQIVNEKLQLVTAQLPPDLTAPTLAPISSVMGEVLFIAVRGEGHDAMATREVADWTLRRRLLAIPGVAQVVPIGGAVRQYQVKVDPQRLHAFDVKLDDVIGALEQSNQNSTGGFYVRGSQESLIRAVGRIGSEDDLRNVVITVRAGVPILVGQVAEVVVGPGVKRGEGSSDARPAVVLGITKQPAVNTLALTERIDRELDAIQRTLPRGMVIDRDKARQADFIEASVENVSTALRDGAILVALILFLFLFNVRTTLVSLASVPLSLLVAVLAMDRVGVTINTMTLGGMTIAIGALVDDAIIDVENVFRRLRENGARPEAERRPTKEVIYEASREVRGSIVFATLIVMLVFVPIFFLSGVEGRLLRPLGFAYLVAIFASLVVALTLTPALCSYVLGRVGETAHRDPFVVRTLKRAYAPLVRLAVRRPLIIGIAATALLAATLALVPSLGRTFLPEFNEGALTVSAVTLPGTSLEESDKLGRRVEEVLRSFPEVVSTARRTGRAELDEHAQDVNAGEIDVRLKLGARSKEAFLAELRRQLTTVPGVVSTIGGPIAHRIDHMLSGTRASIAIKIFGDDLTELRATAERARQVMAKVPGVVDLAIEQQVDVPQLAITFDREAIARYGLRSGALAEIIETAYAGRKVTQVLERQRTYDVVVRYRDDQRVDLDAIRNTVIDTPSGARVPLKMLASIREDVGPNTISRENVQRKVVVSANVGGRDLRGVIDDIRAGIEQGVTLPEGYYVVYGGQFESEQAASRTLSLMGLVVIVGIFGLLFFAFRSLRNALLIMINLPLALIGGVIAIAFGSGVVSVASLVGFVTLFGIATRNGIMMISHYEHLRRVEHAAFEEAVTRGSMERLSPVLMTALCAGLGLVPLVIAGGQPGNELQAPMAVVILGGLVSSTLLNMLVIPALYARFARPTSERSSASIAPSSSPPSATTSGASGGS
ncbi:MAG: efflux RND transporter permease subunit [Deltaproteobacteria bacterium]|nr:efflux RND transporter permease subunit [Deltaproteobacteria bacterium]